MNRLRLLFCVSLTVIPLGCGLDGTVSREVPLLDGHHAPDVFAEAGELALLPTTDANRVVKGWVPFRREGEILLYAAPSTPRLEIANLGGRARTLVLQTEIHDGEPGGPVSVAIAGREAHTQPLTVPLTIELPVDLPKGRVGIDLEFPEDTVVAISGAGFSDEARPGEARFETGKILQRGWSVVDVVRQVEGGTRLVGTFVPPPDAGDDQYFELIAEREGETPKTLYRWHGGWFGRLRGSGRFSASLGDLPGLVRIRMESSGRGRAASWEGVNLRAPLRPVAEPPVPDIPKSPKVVILYVLDALRADALGHLGGDPEASPVLDRLAGEGVTLVDHLSVAPNTPPSTKALFVGRAFRSGGGDKLLANGSETLAEVFQQAGYRTGVFSTNPWISESFGTTRGFDFDSGLEYARDKIERPYNNSAERVHAAALQWLEDIPSDDPVFLYLHTLNPHNPYDPPEPFHSAFTAEIDSSIDAGSKTLLSIKQLRVEPSPSDQERIAGLYRGNVAYNDAEIDRFLGALLERYPKEEILLVLTGDHGDELFEHQGVLHGYTLYREQLEIPLIFWWPETLEPRRIDAATDNLDAHETLRALAGGSPSRYGEGRSLWDLLLGSPEPVERKDVRFAAAANLKGGIFSAQSASYKLIYPPRTGKVWGLGEGRGRTRDHEYLFDLKNDPGEMSNLAGMKSLEADWLRSRLVAWIERGRLADEEALEEAEIDDETLERLQALGYLN